MLSSVELREKSITASKRSSSISRSAVISSARAEASGGIWGGVCFEGDPEGVFSGDSGIVEMGEVAEDSKELIDSVESSLTGDEIGDFARTFGHVLRSCPGRWHILHLRDIIEKD